MSSALGALLLLSIPTASTRAQARESCMPRSEKVWVMYTDRMGGRYETRTWQECTRIEPAAPAEEAPNARASSRSGGNPSGYRPPPADSIEPPFLTGSPFIRQYLIHGPSIVASQEEAERRARLVRHVLASNFVAVPTSTDGATRLMLAREAALPYAEHLVWARIAGPAHRELLEPGIEFSDEALVLVAVQCASPRQRTGVSTPYVSIPLVGGVVPPIAAKARRADGSPDYLDAPTLAKEADPRARAAVLGRLWAAACTPKVMASLPIASAFSMGRRPIPQVLDSLLVPPAALPDLGGMRSLASREPYAARRIARALPDTLVDGAELVWVALERTAAGAPPPHAARACEPFDAADCRTAFDVELRLERHRCDASGATSAGWSDPWWRPRASARYRSGARVAAGATYFRHADPARGDQGLVPARVPSSAKPDAFWSDDPRGDAADLHGEVCAALAAGALPVVTFPIGAR